MHGDFQASRDIAEHRSQEQEGAIALLQARLAEVTAAAQEEHRVASEARTHAESVRQQAYLDSVRMQANAHDLASKMQNANDA